jgi:hypothetical protein
MLVLVALAAGCGGDGKAAPDATVQLPSPDARVGPPDAGPPDGMPGAPSALPDGGFADNGALPLAADPDTLDFAYIAPQACGNDWLARYAEEGKCRDAFASDLGVMSALGARVVKLVMPPQWNGQTFEFDTCGGEVDNPDLAKVEQNLPTVVEALAAHGMKVVVNFTSNEWFLRSSFGYWPGNNGQDYWSQTYACQSGTEAENAAKLGDDMVKWQNGIIGAIQADAAAAAAIEYYLVLTEVNYCQTCSTPWSASIQSVVARHVFAGSAAPAGKLGADSGVRVPDSVLLAADASAAHRTIDFTEVHVYPDQLDRNGLNQDVGAAVAEARKDLPGSIVTIGELGSRYCEAHSEANQISTPTKGGVADILAEAHAASVAQAMNWDPYDYDDATCEVADNGRFGIGFSIEKPRDLYGWLAEHAGGLTNGDFERDAQGWLAGGTGPGPSLARVGPANDAATGSSYLRLTDGDGWAWACTPLLSVAGRTHFIVGGYVRSDLTNLSIDLYSRAAGSWSVTHHPKTLLGDGGTWRQLQGLAGPAGDLAFDFGPLAGVDRFLVCFAQLAPAGEHHLDLDAVSVQAY